MHVGHARSFEPVHQAQPGDAANLAQRSAALGSGVVAQPPPELGQDGAAAMAAHAQDEREAETLAVGRVQAREVLVRGARQAKRRLLGRGVAAHRPLQRGSSGEFGMAAEERPDLGGRSSLDGPHHRCVQRGDAGERPGGRRLFRNPRRVLEDVAEHGRHVGGRSGVQPVQGEPGGGHEKAAASNPSGIAPRGRIMS